MKILCNQRRSERGSILAVALVTAAILGVSLASYLRLVNSQSASVSRSQSWNSALALAEAGVEEALAHLNTPGADLSANGWGEPVNGVFGPTTRSMPGGSYSVVISTNPVTAIFSTGTVNFASASVSRVVRVNVKKLPLINAAFAARYGIQMNGNGLAANSFNSHDPQFSNGGHYDSSKTRNNGDVASVFGPVDFGNHTIAGDLYLGPNAAYNSGEGQVQGQIYYDFNVDYPDVVLPTTVWYTAPTQTIKVKNKKTTYYHFTTSGDYTISDSTPILVEPNVTVRLKVTTSNFSPADIHVLGGLNDSGTLIIYHVAGSASMAGNTTVDSLRAENFWYFGLPGVTSVTLSGTSSYVGVIYAPSADLTLNGGGNNDGLIGSSITKKITMNGHYDFHYDEALGLLGPSRGYVPISWEELK